ncbi:MAG: hypothetical protein ACYDCK_01430 [Thermoplasmatota archaeon]
MPSPSFGSKPANYVWAGGAPREFSSATFKVKTTTGLRAGLFVKRDTTDDQIQQAVAGDTNVIGVLGMNLSNPEWDPTTAPAAGDLMEVILCGSGAWAWIRNGAALLAGAKIQSDASGQAAVHAVAAAGDADKKTGVALIDNDGSVTVSDVLAVI